MTETSKAVFLSYARDDSAAARRIAEALRASGLEVWFDENELRGGDAWDARIRHQIDACSIFIPIISSNTQSRDKGYFRLEWKLAADETALLAEGVPFIIPVVIDDTRESGSRVPAEFLKVQWTRLPGALPTPEFVAHVGRLLRGDRAPSPAASTGRPGTQSAVAPASRPTLSRWFWAATAIVVMAGIAAMVALQPPRGGAADSTISTTAPAATTQDREADPSIAVLAFADLSEGRNSEYLSDGITEELLNVLAQVPGLRVAARTSSFYFKGKNLPVPEIAQKLNVGYVVEGSVQRAGDRVKITAQLIKADGFHVWSDTFVRELKDVFAVQDEIAGLIAQKLERELGSATKRASVTDPRVVELYLQAQQDVRSRTKAGLQNAERSLREALRIDPGFARAHAALADTLTLRWDQEDVIGRHSQIASPKLAEIRALVDRSLELDPQLAEGHAAMGGLLLEEWKFVEAEAAFRRAIALNPNYASAHQWLGRALMADGRIDEAIAEQTLAATLDPLSHRIQDNLAGSLFSAGRTQEALTRIDMALSIKPDSDQALAFKAGYLNSLKRHEEALTLCRKAIALDSFWWESCYAIFVTAGRRAEADAWNLDWSKASFPAGRDLALKQYQKALDALDPAQMSWRDVGWINFGRDLDPLRKDPRFLAFVNELGITEAYGRAQAWRAAHGL
jgi:TolB-like protein/tetratricopeptide (TPR) repeat protein